MVLGQPDGEHLGEPRRAAADHAGERGAHGLAVKVAAQREADQRVNLQPGRVAELERRLPEED